MYIVLTTHVISSPQDRVQSGDIYSFNAMCKLLIHPGDTYISCIINRNNKSECYYEGIGTVGEILSADDAMFYAKLENYRRFENKVPLTLPDGKYVEHLGRENTNLNPITSPRSVRLLKNDAYDYILEAGGRQLPIACPTVADCSKLEDLLKNSIRSYFVGQTAASIFHVERISHRLGKAISVATSDVPETDFFIYKPSSFIQVVDPSMLEIENELQQTRVRLEEEKHRRETLENELHSISRCSEEVEQLQTALSQAKAQYQDLLLQRQQLHLQLSDSQEAYCEIERKLADTTKQISTLEDQLEQATSQRNALQDAVDRARARVMALEHELADIVERYNAEKLLRKQAEDALAAQQESQVRSEQGLLAKIEHQTADNSALREKLEAAESRQHALQTSLDESSVRIEVLTQECLCLAQQRDAEVMRRTGLESELNRLKEQHQHLEATHADISRLERKVRALEQHNERLEQDLRISEFKRNSVCCHCGGTFTGFIRKKCSVCGRVKDY